MRGLIPVMLAVALVAGCRTSDDGSTEAKDIESVEKLTLQQGTNGEGQAIAVIRCKPGWKDGAANATAFAVAWDKVANKSFGELEMTYCTKRVEDDDVIETGIPSPNPGPEGFPGSITTGRYQGKHGRIADCRTMMLDARTQDGKVKYLDATCEGGQTYRFACAADRTCLHVEQHRLEIFDNGEIDITIGSKVDTFVAKSCPQGFVAYRGGCWQYAQPSVACSAACQQKGLSYDDRTNRIGTDSQGSFAACKALASEFSVEWTYFQAQPDNTGGFGCMFYPNERRLVVYGAGTPDGASQSFGRRFCACL